jgi:TolB-like protein/Flp pilus assembly protein TadD
MIGETISHYVVLDELGSGGMGDVYRAEDTSLKRTVALKFLPRELTLDHEARQRFVQEAQAASALDHPNIGTIYEIDEADGKSFIAMACYEGGSLRDRIAHGPLPVGEAVDIALQMARGLAKAHAKGIIHRDIKPANVMLSDDGQVKIVDFGLAKLAGNTLLTHTGTTLGTVSYMSPEQAGGKTVDHRSDIWSIGVVLHEMLAGDRPFKGDYEQAIVYAVLNANPEFVSAARPDTPPALEKIIEKALEKDPSRRYQTCEELVEELELVARGVDAGDSEDSSSIRRLSRRQRKTFRRVAVVAAVAVIALAAIILTRGVEETAPIAIAVLPMSVEGGPGDLDWFSEGMTDALITELALMEDLRVISKRSVMMLATDKSYPEIAQELDVTFVVDGSVTKVGDQVMIAARLADAETDQYLWAERFETTFSDVLSTQRQIAGAIGEEVLGEASPHSQERLDQARAMNPEVYEAYLRGMHHIAKYTPDDIAKGLAYLQEAVDIDPADAHAWAGLAIGYVMIDHGPIASDVRDRASAAAQRAVRLDSTLAEAWAALGMTLEYYSWDWEGAERAYQRASELNPSLAMNHYNYAWLLLLLDRLDEAVAEHELAVKLDPLYPPQMAWMGDMYRMAGRLDEALEHVDKAFELGEASGIAHLVRGKILFDLGRIDEAIAEHKKMVDVSTVWQGLLGITYAKAGRVDEARAIAEEIEQRCPFAIEAWELAQLYSHLGDADKAFEWAETRPGHMFVPWLSNQWAPMDNVRDDPRYESFLRQLDLPQHRSTATDV